MRKNGKILFVAYQSDRLKKQYRFHWYAKLTKKGNVREPKEYKELMNKTFNMESGFNCCGYTSQHEEILSIEGLPNSLRKPIYSSDRIEHLRRELDAERISYEEIIELQNLIEYIDPSDVQMLEAAGVPEFA